MENRKIKRGGTLSRRLEPLIRQRVGIENFDFSRSLWGNGTRERRKCKGRAPKGDPGSVDRATLPQKGFPRQSNIDRRGEGWVSPLGDSLKLVGAPRMGRSKGGNQGGGGAARPLPSLLLYSYCTDRQEVKKVLKSLLLVIKAESPEATGLLLAD